MEKEKTNDEIASILDKIVYKDWLLYFGIRDYYGIYLQWSFLGKCPKTGLTERQHARKWHVSRYMTESEIVQTAFKAALTAEEHECREHFRYQDKRVFGPHISVQALLTVCDIEETRA